MSKVKEKLLGKWEEKVSQLAIETGYEFDHIWRIWIDLLGAAGIRKKSGRYSKE